MSRMRDLLQALADKGLTLGSVESMTGGLFAARATNVPGASYVFKGGIVAYTREVKEKLVGVDSRIIDRDGVVSELVAQQLAQKGRVLLGADIAVSITGNAGPDVEPGGEAVGRFYLGLATKDGVWSFGYNYEGNRPEIRDKAVELMVTFVMSQVG